MELRGLPAAPGVAVGPAWRYGHADGRDAPLPDVRAAADKASRELESLADRVRALGRTGEADIFDAQAMMAVDPMLLEEAESRVGALGGTDPDALAAAVEAVARAVAETLAGLPDAVLAARAADVRDVGSRIARIVAGRHIAVPDRPSIAIADDLPPSVTAELPPGILLGVVLEGGSPVSHAAILARGLGIPAVVAASGLLAAVTAAEAARRPIGDGGSGGSSRPAPDTPPDPIVIGLDGDDGSVVLAPSRDRIEALEARRTERVQRGATARTLRGQPGMTADGTAIPLRANIGRPDEAARAIEAGAEGVGLFRSEFLYIGRSDAPSEDEQVDAYAAAFDAFGPCWPVVVRLADIGGDKALPYLRGEPEANPFLGVRGLRLAYHDRALLVTQVRAIARAGARAGTVPELMAPMVATAEDVALLHGVVEEALAGLDRDGVERAAHLAVGIMVEVPSAALIAAELAAEVDFFSIGSNDLTQYVLAMDRTNARLASKADALHPAVLRAIRATVEGAATCGIPVAVCGELAADPLGAAVLVGLGVNELSMDAGALDAVRLMLSRRTMNELRELAGSALNARSAAEVRTAAAALVNGA